ncbi:MAG: hypothetical protein GTO45_15290 [Candidatus Aminicenantes bacterium]|nr:hypothetical protein [Candidatus Aminicenantes bacterium]NIM80133.1 hypothetical protein [Candidatus Aminicenantes bacterium]NIN19471.1 hypothetical protein [Candidatus Aminicenantes bacterium]NIN43370.1 hypothetical protein [Candidatus Aminicenantes bacterium]NIN86115.1 hypothetical protein [Candidatus Aminicenantes bacterium]
MSNCKTVVFAPHDDGAGAFAVLCRLACAMIRTADQRNYKLHLYFLNSSAAKGGQRRLDSLLKKTKKEHKAFFVPTDNLIWLPKDDNMGAVIGEQIPDILRKWVRPLWRCWPCEPNWIHPNLAIMRREDWIRPQLDNSTETSREKWKEKISTGWGNLRELTPEWWQRVSLGISMGVPQLHRVARTANFPSVEVGDWFFSVGLRGCMQESFVPPEIIATAEPDLRMIEEDEFKAREVWLTLHQAPREAYKAHVANSPVKFREMKSALWTGDDPPDPIMEWSIANELRNAIKEDIGNIRGSKEDVRIAYIVTGKTPVWSGIVEKLKSRGKQPGGKVAIIEMNRNIPVITLLEDHGRKLEIATSRIMNLAEEEMHLATCRASDLGIARSAGGVLGFAETRRPSVFVDEPGHWLGRIQREQCHQAGLCVVVPVNEFQNDPAYAIQIQAEKLGKNSDLDQTVEAAKNLHVGAERDLAKYLCETYIE